MSDVSEFVNDLFEKSKAINDLNTEFLRNLEVSSLNTEQRLNLFYHNTRYHENLLSVLSVIVKDLDKTSVLLSEPQQQLLGYYKRIEEYTQKKLLKVLKSLGDTVFVPKYLSTCPFCGTSLLSSKDHNKSCKRVALQVGGDVLGYTIDCMYKKNLSTGEENNESARTNKKIQ